MRSVLFLLAVANDTSFHFFLRLTSTFSKVLRSQGLWITVKAKIKCEMYHILKIIGTRRLAYWSWLIFETKETKGYSNTTASYSLLRYFWLQKTEIKPEFSKKLDKVFPRSNRRYKLRFHRGSIAENAPILSSGTVQDKYRNPKLNNPLPFIS